MLFFLFIGDDSLPRNNAVLRVRYRNFAYARPYKIEESAELINYVTLNPPLGNGRKIGSRGIITEC